MQLKFSNEQMSIHTAAGKKVICRELSFYKLVSFI